MASIIFGILFTFLLIILIVFIISRFIRREYVNFEPKVSVLTPAYNEEKNIGECIQSIFDSNYPKNKIEVIVVDDGSIDKTLGIVKKFKNVKLIKQNHLGKVEALNNGTLNSSYEYVLTIDADTTLHKDCIRELVKPFSDASVGATTGNNNVKNKGSFVSIFQTIEYHFSNLIRNGFSTTFNNGIWFSGSIACYKKSVLKKVGYFKKDTMAEDQDIALEIKRNGYKTINVSTATAYTIVPIKLKELYKQRNRWWIGTLQAIFKNRSLVYDKTSPSIWFLYFNQIWWSFYAFLYLPIIIYQINYWMPHSTISGYITYFFRWFSLVGPAYVIYKIPEWGVSTYYIFGVMSGIVTAILAISALRMFKEKITIEHVFAIFFYFPYTILLNLMILISILANPFWKKSFYLK
ncbi:glycosyltransferase family 2 protein [Candidatus Woesearchaeota archaeon]|nr:glycosyltransferase family 2 protein [Candidatus Woesearchaeota archaeon]